MKPERNNTVDNNVFDAVKNTRRDFLKTLGVAALGAGSTMFDPASLLADTQYKNAAEITAGICGNPGEELAWYCLTPENHPKSSAPHQTPLLLRTHWLPIHRDWGFSSFRERLRKYKIIVKRFWVSCVCIYRRPQCGGRMSMDKPI